MVLLSICRNVFADSSYFFQTKRFLTILGLFVFGAPLTEAQMSPLDVWINGPLNGNVVSVGTNVTLTAATNGTGPFTYQWYKDGALISGATASTYVITPVSADSDGKYIVSVTSPAGTGASPEYTLLVKGSAPVITQQPTAQTINAGDTLTLSVTVSGKPPFSFFWYRNNRLVRWHGGMSPSDNFVEENAQSTDAGSYFVRVEESFPPSEYVQSSTVSVAVHTPPPVITQSPISQTVPINGSVIFSITAEGSGGTLGYQWYKDGVSVASISSMGNSGDTPILSIGVVRPEYAGTYTVRVVSSGGTVVSSPAVLTTTPGIVVTLQPTSQTVAIGDTAVFSVAGTSEVPFLSVAYQWQKDGVPISGAVSSTLTITNVQPADVGTYAATLRAGWASVSTAPAILTLAQSAAPPAITTHPSSLAVASGALANFTISATGTAPLTYQWLKNGNPISGVTGATLSLSNVQSGDVGDYSVVVTNSAGSATSNVATLAITETGSAPVITRQPAPAILLAPSGNLSASVTATGTEPLTYQWYKNNASVAGQTSATLAISGANITDSGEYTLVISNAAGSVTSRAVRVTVTSDSGAPVVQVSPTTVYSGAQGPVLLTTIASGFSPITYQWYRNGELLTGVTASSIAITDPAGSLNNEYFVVATNSIGAVCSNLASVIAGSPPSEAPIITGQPAGQTVVSGGTATFTIGTAGTLPLSIAWYHNGVLVPGGSLPTLTLANVQAGDGGSYYARVTNAVGSVQSDTVTLTVNAPGATPAFTVQPTSQTVPIGGDITLVSAATGAPVPTYQWYRQGGAAIPGATSANLTLVNAQLADGGDYYVVATNSSGNATSVAARVTISSSSVTIAPTIVQQPISQNIEAGGTVTFAVVANGTPSPTYQWHFNGAAISGATASTYSRANLTAANAGSYTVQVTNSVGSATSNSALLTVLAPENVLTITSQPTSQKVGLGHSVTFSVGVSRPAGNSYQWFKNDEPVSGVTSASFTLGSVSAFDVGSYHVVVTNRLDAAPQVAISHQAILTLSEEEQPASAVFAGTYLGGLGSGSSEGNFALMIRNDGTGVMLVHLAKSRTAIITSEIKLNADGSFSVSGSELSARSGGNSSWQGGDGAPPTTPEQRDIAGYLAANGSISGSISGINGSFNGMKAGGDVKNEGFYQATAVNRGFGSVYAIVAANGEALVVAQHESSIEGGIGKITAQGKLSVVTNAGTTLSGTLDANTGEVSAVAEHGPLAGASFAGLRDDVPRTDRLGNISTRGRAGAGDDVMIAGFVLSGSYPRPVLIRAVGPTLATFGVDGALADSRLELFRGTDKILVSDNWGNEPSATAISAAAERLGAFTLPSNGKDAVLLTTLEPGGYTAQVTGPNGTGGVALVEVYDAGEGANTQSAPKLVNISTRGRVGMGDEVLIAGIVVTGNAPKRLLVRAIGPTLSKFGITGALSDPYLKIFDSDSVLISANDNWGGGGDISAAAASVAAFPFESDKEASLIITLKPGNYTAQVSGVASSTGVALVEVYELGY